MGIYLDLCEYNHDTLKAAFGNRRNYQRFCWCVDQMRLQILCGVERNSHEPS